MNTNTIAITGLYESAFLLMRGHKLLEIRPVTPRKSELIFANPDGEAQRDLDAYLNNEVVPAQLFAAQVVSLKGRLFSRQ